MLLLLLSLVAWVVGDTPLVFTYTVEAEKVSAEEHRSPLSGRGGVSRMTVQDPPRSTMDSADVAVGSHAAATASRTACAEEGGAFGPSRRC